MKIKSIYMAGTMGYFKDNPELMKEWRRKATHILNKYAEFKGTTLEIVDPTEFYDFQEPPKQKTEKEIMDYDLFQLTHSNLVLVNLNNIYNSPGTIIELYEAKRRGIPVIAFWDNNNINSELHPWIRECINRIEDDLNKAIAYINDFYL